jgi:uncharacterized phage protein (TIGR02220 family)
VPGAVVSGFGAYAITNNRSPGLNYYNHHIGDYAAATEHLTWLEDLAYTRLIRIYYRTEKPIPLDKGQVFRLVRAVSKQEREAVESVLCEFFTRQDDGYHQKRCDEELAHMQEKSEKARQSVGKRWQKTDTNVDTNVHTKADTNVLLGQQCEGNTPNSQYPIANSQEPVEKEKATPLSGKPDVLRLNGYRREAQEVLDFLNAKTGSNYQAVDSNLKLIAARLKEGATVDDCRAVVAMKVREWGNNELMADYLRPKTLFNSTNFAQYRGKLIDED